MKINNIRYDYFSGHGHDTLIDYDGGGIYLSTLATRVKRDCKPKWHELYRLVNEEMICITSVDDDGTVRWLDKYGDQLTSKSATIRTHAEQKPKSRWAKIAAALDRYIAGERKQFIAPDRAIKVIKFSGNTHAVVEDCGNQILVSVDRDVELRNMGVRPMRWTPIYAAMRKFVHVDDVSNGRVTYRVLNGNLVVKHERTVENINHWCNSASDSEFFLRVRKAYYEYVAEQTLPDKYCTVDVNNAVAIIDKASMFKNPCVEILLGEPQECSLKPREIKHDGFITTWEPDFKCDRSIVPQEFRRHWEKNRGMGTIVDGCLVALYLCAEGTYKGYCEELRGLNYELTVKSDYTVTNGCKHNLPIYVVATGLPGRFTLEDFDVRY